MLGPKEMSNDVSQSESRALSTRLLGLIALALFFGSIAVLLATPDVGFSRDEAFYFEYGQSYDDWLVDVQAADDLDARQEALGRDAVLKTWRGNFEHPPLMKSLFGLSRRLLARKDRAVGQWRLMEGEAVGNVKRLSPSDGFTVGADVWLLVPLAVGQDPVDEARESVQGRVASRQGRGATVVFPGETLDQIRALCAAPPRADLPAMGGCEVRELRAWAPMDEATAMRFPAMVFTGLVLVFTFFLGVCLFNWQTGLFGAIAFFVIPRHFYHAHLACFDMPIVAATLATFYAFWRSLEDRRWAIVAGFFWGIALLIKHNAFFLPVPLMLIWLWLGRHQLRVSRDGWRLRLQLPPLPLAFLVMPPIGLTVLFVAWPRLWYDPFVALSEYFAFHLEHVHYFQWYLGLPLQVPPFPMSQPFGLTLFTVPAALLLLAAVGVLLALRPVVSPSAWRALRRSEAPTHHEKALVFTTLNAFFPILLIAIPTVPIFGGIKHWMTAMPFLMLLAGYAFDVLRRNMLGGLGPRWQQGLAALMATVVLSSAAVASHRALPFGPGYYNDHIAGGIRGAADKQLMRTYWGMATREALDWVNRRAPRNARLYFQNTPLRAVELYKRVGLLRHDIRPTRSAHGASIALVEPQKSFTEAEDLQVRRAFQQAGPRWTLRFDGVNQLRVYVRRGAQLLD